MKNIRYLVLALLFPVVHQLSGQQVDIGIFTSSTANQMEIIIRPNYDEDGTHNITNAQFTIKWPVSSGITKITSAAPDPYNIIAQGAPVQNGGFYYQRYATSGGYILSWEANEQIVVRAFTFVSPPCPLFEIADDAFVKQISINGAYYFEVNGASKTGIIYQVAAQQPSPSAAGIITGTSSVCQSQKSVAYSVASVSNASSYAWTYTGTGAAITNNGTSITIDFSASATSGNLSVHGVNGCGNGTESQAFPITVNPAPTGGTALAAAASVCPGGSTTLTLSNYTGSVQWQQSADGSTGWAIVTGGSGGTTSTYTTPGLTVTTWYRAVVTGGSCGAANSNAVKVMVNPLPVVNAGTDKSIPFGTSIKIEDATASGTAPMLYSWTPAALFVNATLLNPNTVNLTTTNSFTLTVTDGNGCVNSDALTISVTGGALAVNPTATFSEVCAGASSQLKANASGGSRDYTYSWSSNPAGFTSSLANPFVSPTATTTYSVTVNDGYNTISRNVTVSVNTLPVAPVSGGNKTICTGQTIPPLTVTVGSGETADWFAASSGGTALLSGALSFTPSVAGTYFAEARNTSTGCVGTTRTAVTLTVNGQPVAPVSGGNKIICSNQSYPILTVTTGTGITADWYSAAAAGTSLVTGNLNYTPASSGIWYAEARNTTTGCISATRTAVTLTVNPNPAAPVSGGNKAICTNLPLPALTVTVGTDEKADWYGVSSGGTAVTTGSLNFSPSAAGTWYSEARNTISGCISTTRTPVTLKVNPLPVVNAGADQSIATGTATTITDATASGMAPLIYTWTPAASFVNATLLNPATVNLAATNSYMLTVTDGNGCTKSDMMTITVTIPSAIILEVTGYGKKLWPNPTTGPVNFDLRGDTVRELELRVFNAMGIEVLCKKYQSCSKINFDLSKNPSGMYLVVVNFDGTSIIQKLILAKD